MSILTGLSSFTPHGFCLAWQPGLIWLMAGSDLMIAAAYFSIPAALVVFLRRRKDLAFRPVFGLFAAFILACGTTHVLGAVTLWVPLYWLQGGINGLTAALSVSTALVLWPMVPKALALPSPSNLRMLNEELARQIEQRDQAAASLRESQVRLRQLYDRTPAPLHATDGFGTLIEVNDRWLELAGRERAEVIGRNIGEFYEPDDAKACVAQLSAFRAGRGATTASHRFLRGDGERRHVELLFDLERDEQGALHRVLAALTDVTARHRAEAALRVTEDHLRQAQKMEAVGQLTGGIAHDFNNLLTTIIGSLELLELRPGLDERARHLAENAASGARRAARLTSQLLSFSRRQLLRPEALMPHDIVLGIEALLAGSLREGISFAVMPPGPELWPLLADSNQIESALLNLVINARDAIEREGRITIAFDNVTVQENDALAPDGLMPADYVAIHVTDTGSGMTEETRARALEPFFTTKPAGSGTGLGLSQTYGFVRQSQGALSIRSSAGAGTTVSILLPRAHVNPETKQEDADRAAQGAAGRVSGIHQARRAAIAPKKARAQNASGAL